MDMTVSLDLAFYEDAITKIRSLEADARKINDDIEALKSSLKEDMVSKGVEKVDTAVGIVRYADVVSNRFDTTAFKKADPDAYSKYLVESVSKRFTIK